jgi:hypothetical protein
MFRLSLLTNQPAEVAIWMGSFWVRKLCSKLLPLYPFWEECNLTWSDLALERVVVYVWMKDFRGTKGCTCTCTHKY